ncbi:uncharacterized protein LTR77_004743 [Saxophila tyrrhenica]|uniref:BZIP domain-containing protein n=1 Tax=Saxophila tyrrhenica TaxID=1690608 RepID=A0AAV9PAR8_9PEZI|nr:hypothetical protein LTR77_004743 [Saxophila tyrrhenica]
MDSEADSFDIPAEAHQARDVVLPTIAAERKRVLNILAQRRYRRRRRERQAALERNVSKTSNKTATDQPLIEDIVGLICDSSRTTASPEGAESTASNEIAMPYTNGSTWTPEGTIGATNVVNFFDDLSWTSIDVASSLTSFLQSDDTQNTSFADDFNLAVPELDLLRAAYQIAGQIRSAHLLFAGLRAQSVFLSSDYSSLISTLPKNLQPTTAQLTMAHHPIIDILPWPAVRTRLVNMYSLPSDLWPRHPSDGSESSLMRLVYDMEDGGVRVDGGDPAYESGWEVEQAFFDVWWWALDQNVISNSNRKRALRGVPKLSCHNIAGMG